MFVGWKRKRQNNTNIMKLRNLFLGACSLVLAFTACDELMQSGGGSGNPDLSLDKKEMNFEVAGGDQTLTLSSTRAWKVETDADWVTVDPASGDAGEDQTVTVSVLENTGLDRSVDLKFTIGMISRYLTVNQKGPSGSADALIAYANDFDIDKAQNNSGWPYLDSNTNLWDNKKGTGASTVTYEYGGKMSVRTSGKLSNNNEGFSHYSGSGMNKVFFGAATSIFKINNITLGSGNNYTLSYGGQKYLQGADCNYSFEEMKVYVSNDAQKWVPVTMAFPADADIDGDWNLATGNFTLPEGTSTLSIAFVCTASSAYSIDDVLLQVSDTAGQTIDFSTGVAIDGTTPGSGGGNTGGDTAGKPATLQKVTIAEFLAAAEDDTWYELTGEIINIAKEDYGNFTIKDATDEVYIYGMTSKWVGSNDKSFSQIGLKVGDTVTLGTKRGSFNGTPQGGGNPVPAYYISHVAGEGSGDQGEVTPPAGGSAMTVAEVLAYSGALPAGTTVEGVVISNKDLNNLTSKKGMYIQDETAGLQFYLAANHTFAFGDKVQIDLSGVTVGAYDGAVQVSGLALEKITKVSSGNTVTAKTVTIADFLANKYEGQYIAIEGVQVAASDLSKTWVSGGAHTSINMEDANGNKFVVFSSKYATYGTAAVPQGSGTIKGISSISKGAMQIIFAQESDFAGLTGNRFDGTVVTPPAGGDDDDNGDDDNTGNVTPVGGNSDDFAALTSSRYYEASLTTPNGWVLNNCQVHTYGTANSNDTFAYVPEGNKAVCMNGKTAAAGKVTSPVIAGGCEALSFNYCYPFSESNGVSIKVEILQNDAVVKSFDVVNKTAAKYEVCSHTEQIGVTGNFTIRFSNNSPSNNSSSNKDRYSIWNITWTSKAE